MTPKKSKIKPQIKAENEKEAQITPSSSRTKEVKTKIKPQIKAENEKEPQIKEESKPFIISKEVITIKYDLNWFYMRSKILSYSHIFKSLFEKYMNILNKIEMRFKHA